MRSFPLAIIVIVGIFRQLTVINSQPIHQQLYSAVPKYSTEMNTIHLDGDSLIFSSPPVMNVPSEILRAKRSKNAGPRSSRTSNRSGNNGWNTEPSLVVIEKKNRIVWIKFKLNFCLSFNNSQTRFFITDSEIPRNVTAANVISVRADSSDKWKLKTSI